MQSTHYSGKVMVYVDGSNLFHGIGDYYLGNGLAIKKISYEKLKDLVVDGRPYLRANYYGSYHPSGDARQFSFFSSLEYSGYDVKKYPLRVPTSAKKVKCTNCDNRFEDITCLKCNKLFRIFTPEEKGVDVGIAIDMITQASKGIYETAVLIGGDKDHLEVVETVKNDFGKRVEVVNFTNRTSAELRRKADKFVPLENYMKQIEM